MQELEAWLTERLKSGLSVKEKFPTMYQGEFGFGYEVSIKRNKEIYFIMFVKKGVHKPDETITLTIHEIYRYYPSECKKEPLRGLALIGKKVILTPMSNLKAARNDYSITGTLTL